MAEDQDDAQKTEEPTPRKLQEAHKKGQVITSQEVKSWFILLGLLGSVTMWFMTLAYRHAPAAVIAPFDYTILLWGLLLGWLIPTMCRSASGSCRLAGSLSAWGCPALSIR